jgi:Ca-activated chloride channel family protein
VGRFGSFALVGLAGVLAVLAQETVFKVDVQLVRLLVNVKDTSSGRLVGSLNQEDFTILDSGVPQQITLFERQTEQPLSVAVLIDASGSTAKELEYETTSVRKFMRALIGEGNPGDTAALYAFNYQVMLLTSYTRRLSRLEGALKNLRAEAGTSLYDAIYLASNDLEDRDGRHVLIVITDGGDTTSVRNFHHALEAAHRADAVLYGVLVMPITNDAGRNIGGENALINLASGTGGRVFFPGGAAALDDAFQEILRDLRTQYLIGYYPRNVLPVKGGFHRIEVKLKNPDLRPQTRTGYYETSSR